MTRLGLGDRIGLAAGIVLCVAAAVFAVAYGQSPTPPRHHGENDCEWNEFGEVVCPDPTWTPTPVVPPTATFTSVPKPTTPPTATFTSVPTPTFTSVPKPTIPPTLTWTPTPDTAATAAAETATAAAKTAVALTATEGRGTHGVRSAHTAKAHPDTHAHTDAYSHPYAYTDAHTADDEPLRLDRGVAERDRRGSDHDHNGRLEQRRAGTEDRGEQQVAGPELLRDHGQKHHRAPADAGMDGLQHRHGCGEPQKGVGQLDTG